MTKFEKYIESVKQQLSCNIPTCDKNEYITYEYTNEEVDNHLVYFESCMQNGLSAYKALLFFGDYLTGDFDFYFDSHLKDNLICTLKNKK